MVLEVLAHHELVLVDGPLALPRDVGGADVDEALELFRGEAEVDDVSGAVDVDALRELERHIQAVDRGEVEDELHLRGQPLGVLGGEAKPLLSDVARDHLDPVPVDLGGRLPRRLEHPLFDQRGDSQVGVIREELADEAAADEAGKSGEDS